MGGGCGGVAEVVVMETVEAAETATEVTVAVAVIGR